MLDFSKTELETCFHPACICQQKKINELPNRKSALLEDYVQPTSASKSRVLKAVPMFFLQIHYNDCFRFQSLSHTTDK